MRSSKSRAVFMFCCAVACAAAASAAAAGNAHVTRPGQANNAPSAASTVSSQCTRDHQCANPGCKEAGYGTDDCYTPTTTEPTPSSPCMRDHQCANPGCKEAGYGTDDCYTPTTTEPTATTPAPTSGTGSAGDTNDTGSQPTTETPAPSATPTPAALPAAPTAPFTPPTVTRSAPAAAPARSNPAQIGVVGAHATIIHRASPTSQSGVLGATYTRSKPVAQSARPAQAVLGSAHFTG
jgi:hypothetical protein